MKAKDNRTNDEKRNAVAALLQRPEWRARSDRAIQRELKLGSSHLPGKMRRLLYPDDAGEREYTHKSGTRTRMDISNLARPPLPKRPFGERLRRLRENRGCDVRTLAALCRVSQRRIRELEAGGEPTWPEVQAFAGALRARWSDLAGEEFHRARASANQR